MIRVQEWRKQHRWFLWSSGIYRNFPRRFSWGRARQEDSKQGRAERWQDLENKRDNE
jgi:hypothetical protein